MQSKSRNIALLVAAVFVLAVAAQAANQCIECHSKVTPGVVSDWKASPHASKKIACETCHGTAHTTAADYQKAAVAGPDTCKKCHESQVTQFMSGKHAMAYPAGFAVPSFHNLPRVMLEGGKGCGSCHKFGPKNAEQFQAMKAGGTGTQSSTCDACHTRHLFSKAEARQPQACQTCHQGEDHPQWAMYSGSKHGVRNTLKQVGAIPQTAAAPTCQTCHMAKGDHAVKTAWGLFGLRAPLSDDPKWAADQVTILQGVGALDMNGKPTGLFDALKSLDAFRTTQADWQKERDKMIANCSQCHTQTFAKTELEKGDKLIREADALMAEGVRVVADLYKDGIVEKPASYAAPFPQILTWRSAPNRAEDKLFEMFLFHRENMYQGAYHNNPEWTQVYGYGALVNDLNEIKALAQQLRKDKAESAALMKSH